MIALIVAYSKNKVIGNGGTIPWRIPGEQSRFKELTTGNVVVMGRKTYEDMGHSLPDRINIVVSRTKRNFGDCFVAESLADAMGMFPEKDIYIIGGYQLYLEALDYVDRMYITEIDLVVNGDVFFPEFNCDLFIRRVDKKVSGEIPYEYVTYIRKR